MTSRGKLGAAAAMMAAAVGLGGCGSGDGGKDGGEDGAGTGSTPTATAIPGAGTEAVNSAPPAKLTGRRVRRSGFSIPLPAGYRDATDSKVLANAPVRPDLLLQGAR